MNFHRIAQPSIIITRFGYRFELKKQISLLVFNKKLDKSKCFLLTIQGVSQQKYTNVKLQTFMFVCGRIFHPYRRKVLESSMKYSNLSFRDRISRTRTAKHTSKLLYYIYVSIYKLTSTRNTNTMYLVLFSVEEEKCID